MSEVPAVGYGAVFLGSVALSLLLVPLALRVARRLGALDHPGGRKEQVAPVPYLGGAAIVVAFSLVVLVAAVVWSPVGGIRQIAVVLGLAVALSLLGLLDDLRGIAPAIRMLAVVAAGLVLFALGSRVNLFHPALDLLLTLAWVTGITHALNLLDNMDGLSAGIVAIASGAFGLVAALNGQFLVASLAAALAGCAVGFLRHNAFPARIYMGDAGSLFLGFMLAVLGLELTVPPSPVVASFVPILVLGIPILDTTMVVIGRLLHGRSPFEGGRDHLSHRLVKLGLRVPTAVWTLYAVAAGLGWLGVVMARLEDLTTAYLLLGFVLSVLAVAGLLLGRVPVYDQDVSAAGGDSADAHLPTTAGRWWWPRRSSRRR